MIKFSMPYTMVEVLPSGAIMSRYIRIRVELSFMNLDKQTQYQYEVEMISNDGYSFPIRDIKYNKASFEQLDKDIIEYIWQIIDANDLYTHAWLDINTPAPHPIKTEAS